MGKKARDIAALAGLAGLAYAYNKNKKGDSSTTNGKSGETTSSKKDADDNDTLARANREESSGLSTTKNSVVSAITAPKSASNDKAGNQGVLSQKSVTPKAPPKPTAAKQASSDARNLESGMSRGRPAEAKNPNYSNEGRSSTAPSKVADTVKTVAKMYAQGPIGVAADAAKPLADKATNAMRETYRDLSGKVQYKTPDIPSAAKTVSDAVASGARKVGSGIADYVKNFETPAERRSREAKEASGMKRGGMTKMASGGMTASRRGDGIAQRGKTRGKMC